MAVHHITTDVQVTNPATHTTATYAVALIAAEYVDVGFDIFNCSYAEDMRENIVLQPGGSTPVLTLACDLQHCPWGDNFGFTFVGLHERSPHVLNYYHQSPYKGFD